MLKILTFVTICTVLTFSITENERGVTAIAAGTSAIADEKEIMLLEAALIDIAVEADSEPIDEPDEAALEEMLVEDLNITEKNISEELNVTETNVADSNGTEGNISEEDISQKAS